MNLKHNFQANSNEFEVYFSSECSHNQEFEVLFSSVQNNKQFEVLFSSVQTTTSDFQVFKQQ